MKASAGKLNRQGTDINLNWKINKGQNQCDQIWQNFATFAKFCHFCKILKDSGPYTRIYSANAKVIKLTVAIF